MGMLQDKEDLERWHAVEDPWGYQKHGDDALRVQRVLAELPARSFDRVLDIGCGQGFLTTRLPGAQVTGIDISENAIRHAKALESERIQFKIGSIFELSPEVLGTFDLVVITGVLYPQYIGQANTLIYKIVDRLLAPNATLVSVHIDDWYSSRFPYLLTKTLIYPYREYMHRLEIYSK